MLGKCAANLNVTHDDLLERWAEPQLQRRALELPYETQWRHVFDNLPSDHDRVRLLEETGALARAWLDVPPISPGHRLTDREMRYLLRRKLLGSFSELSSPGVCTKCTASITPLHHTACQGSQAQRSIRHTAIKLCVATHMTQAGCLNVAQEQAVGGNNRGEQVKSDVVATINGRRVHYDVSVVTPVYTAPVTWPTSREVSVDLELDKARPTRAPPIFFWEDHSSETPHPDVVRGRKFRELALARAVYPAITRREQEKRSHFAGVQETVLPLVITAGGCLSTQFRQFVNELCSQLDPDGRDIGAQSTFCRNFINRLTVINAHSLIRLAYPSAPLLSRPGHRLRT